jgi:hypothetical protein
MRSSSDSCQLLSVVSKEAGSKTFFFGELSLTSKAVHSVDPWSPQNVEQSF